MRPRPFRRQISPVLGALLFAIVALGSLVSCRVQPTLSALDHKLYGTSPDAFHHWWIDAQADAQSVSPATVDQWIAYAPSRLGRVAARSGTWDLSTDLCSFAPDAGPTFDFRRACIRHDFAWRNLKRLDTQRSERIDTSARRVRATGLFLADMRVACDARSGVARTTCRTVATSYHRAVLLVA